MFVYRLAHMGVLPNNGAGGADTHRGHASTDNALVSPLFWGDCAIGVAGPLIWSKHCQDELGKRAGLHSPAQSVSKAAISRC